MSAIIWKRAKQQRLLAELRGFWSEDLWDMRNSPVRSGLNKRKMSGTFGRWRFP